MHARPTGIGAGRRSALTSAPPSVGTISTARGSSPRWCRRGSGRAKRDVGQQVAVVLGLARERAPRVRTGQEPGDADVAAEERVLDREQPHAAGQLARAAAPSTAAPISPVTITFQRGADRAVATASDAVSQRAGTRRAVAVGGGAVDPGEEPERGPVPTTLARERGARPRPRTCGPCRCRSRAAGSRRTRRAAGTDARRGGSTRRRRYTRRRPSASTEPRLPALHDVDDRLRLRERVRRASRLHDCARSPRAARRRPSRDSEKRSSTPSIVSSRTAPSLMPGHTTTWPCTSMPASSSSSSQRRLVAPRRLRSSRRAHVGIGRVDADVQRPEPLGHDPLEVGLGETGERREVPVEERQPVVVVLQVQALAHALGQLVDEAERAVVVAGAHPVEHRARQLDAERRALGLVDVRRPLEPARAGGRARRARRRPGAGTRSRRGAPRR